MSRRATAQAEPEPIPLFTISEVAQRWHCSQRHVRRLIDSGELLAVDLATSTGSARGQAMLRVPHEAVAKFERRRQS
jgi:excisionase family DNA binding protein